VGLPLHREDFQRFWQYCSLGYPVVVDTAAGTIQYDNYNEHWGKQAELNRLLQAYACEVAKLEARKKGYAVSEQLLQDGSIRVQIVTAP